MINKKTLDPILGQLYETQITRFFYNKGYLEHDFINFKIESGAILFLVSYVWLERVYQYQFIWLNGNKTLYSEQKTIADFNNQFKIITKHI